LNTCIGNEKSVYLYNKLYYNCKLKSNRIFCIFGLFVRDSLLVTTWDLRIKFIIQNLFQLPIDCWLFGTSAEGRPTMSGWVSSPPIVSNFRAVGEGGRTFRPGAAKRLSFTLADGRAVLLIVIINFFYFFLVFVPRTRSVSLQYTNFYSVDSVVFFQFPRTQRQRKVSTTNNSGTANSIIVVVCVTAIKKSTDDM